jgi:hypothetical protein
MWNFTRLAARRDQRAAACPPEPPADGPVIGSTSDGRLVTWPVPVGIEHAAHLFVLGASGSGKSTVASFGLVSNIVREADVPPDERSALLLIDPKGDLVDAVLAGIAAFAPDRLPDVYLLDPFSPDAFPLNLRFLALGSTPVDIRAQALAGLCASVSTMQGAQAHLGVGSRQLDVLSHVLLAALAAQHPDANVLWALDALGESDGSGLAALASMTTSERARRFLETAKLGEELRVSCASRLRSAFGATDQLERIVAARSSIQWSEVLGPGCICLVTLGRPPGGLVSLQTFYAQLLCSLAIEHLLERPSPYRGHNVVVALDEVQVVARVLEGAAESLLTTGRSRALSLVSLTQGTTLIEKASDSLLPVMLQNCPTKLVGRLAARDAELLGRERAPSRGVDESFSVVRSRFAAAVTNLPDREFFKLAPGSEPQTRFRTHPIDLESWHRQAELLTGPVAWVRSRMALLPTSAPRVTLRDVVPRRKRGTAANAGALATPSRRPRSRWG